MFKKLILILVILLFLSFPCVASAEDIYEEETVAGSVVDTTINSKNGSLVVFNNSWGGVHSGVYGVGEYVNLTLPTDGQFIYQYSIDILSYLNDEQKYLISSSSSVSLTIECTIDYFSDPSPASNKWGYVLYYKVNDKDGVRLDSDTYDGQPQGVFHRLQTDYFDSSGVSDFRLSFLSYFTYTPDSLIDMQYRISNVILTLTTVGVDKSTADIVVNLGNINNSINQGFDQMGDKLDGVQDSINQGVENVTTKQDTIIDKISSGFANIGNQVKKAVTDAVTELFVPSEEDMVAQYDKWDSLMADRFGAVYESSQIIDDFVESIQVSDTQDTINFPVVSVDLVGTTFEFGGWEVDVVPDGFQWLVDILKMVSNVGCTVLFIDGMRSRYESVVK